MWDSVCLRIKTIGVMYMSNKTKVLVIDDDVNICELIRLYMEKEVLRS